MGRSLILIWLLISTFLVVSFSHGFPRKMQGAMEGEKSTVPIHYEETARKSRELISIDAADYKDPQPNKRSPHPPPPTHRG